MVLARVNRVRGRGVDVGVCVVYGKDGEGEGTVCGEEWQGVIRREDVRATEKDKVVCGEGFRVGDVVRGIVVCAVVSFFSFLSKRKRGGRGVRCMCMGGSFLLYVVCGSTKENSGLILIIFHGVVQISLGDQSNYYLTTGKNELGVVMAKSEAGNTMVPISWREFRDPVTGGRESRKVAKPF